MSTPSRQTLLKAVKQLTGAFALVVENRVPGKCVCVEWPNMVERVLVWDKEAIRVVQWVAEEVADA